ncbi:dihydrodipicolinate synthase family protein [Paenibacillus sp. MMS20-IR301]|uniref:dihydrodipicolinate synthase family protein n=1 Tax=Paenibacillus sp. MMS20-IR301 TaxID=2895946 RepID=UPI0028E2A043|nr:dihydrodipicolinate synthase family protein [Paenibacillus sp. MMS20-IR301]WNS43138.1 dihydrodipicolinate synthase family protein [Paenibacillus sp. MMS20-IR301]
MKILNVAIPTPFREDESLNVAGFEPIVAYHMQHGIESLLVSGSTGEQHSMSVGERLQIIEYFNQHPFAGVELIFGVAAIRTRDAVRLVKSLESSVFAAIMIGFPPYIRPTQQQAVAYVEELLGHTSKQVILYNNPGRTGFDLLPESLHTLISRHQNIVGYKEAGDLQRHLPLEDPGDFIRFAAGDVNLAGNFTLNGCNGLSSVAGNIYPQAVREATLRLSQGEQPEAGIEALVERVISGHALINIKRHYNNLGFATGVCRAPIA